MDKIQNCGNCFKRVGFVCKVTKNSVSNNDWCRKWKIEVESAKKPQK